MLILPQTVKIKCRPNNKKYLEPKGYNWVYNEIIEIDVLDLRENAKIYVQVICDYCGKEFSQTYDKIIIQNKNGIIHKDCCKECKGKKIKESNLIKYNVDNVAKLQSSKDKMKQTNLDKYGVEYNSQIEDVKQKKIGTSLFNWGKEFYFQTDDCKEKSNQYYNDNFGVNYPFQVEEIRNKSIETCLIKYGTDNPSKNEEIKNKILQTFRDKFGCDNPMQVEEIKLKSLEKSIASLCKNGNIPTSKQQIYIHNLLGGKLNFTIKISALDIAFPEEKLYIEYDGGGHDLRVVFGKMTQEEFDKKEMRRYYYFKNKGWKMIRLISKNDLLPLDNKIIEMIQYAKDYLNLGHSWIIFDIDNSKIMCSEYEKKYNYGELRRIAKKDIENTYVV